MCSVKMEWHAVERNPAGIPLCTRLVVSFLLLFIVGAAADASEWRERPDWTHFFTDSLARGTFVLYDMRRDRYSVSDRERGDSRFLPASTFKVASTLIALELGVVADERRIFAWDSIVRDIPAWNREHSLRTAFKYSVVPIYQGLARRIGSSRMQRYLRRLRYGNSEIGGGVDRFWLSGDLRISPIEQVQFLRRLHGNQLAVSERSQRIVKDVMLVEATSSYILRAKTGYGSSDDSPGIGWWVGWVEREDNTYFFALNMDIESSDQLNLRFHIARAILRSEDLLP